LSGKELFFLIFAVAGGLALFILGMNIMTDGLRHAAGTRLRKILTGAGRNRIAGIGLGTVLGTLVQSSATSVMLVGFVNAGLMSLESSIAPILGANIGTTFSMQAISFKLGAYCYAAIALGFLFQMGGPSERARALGQAVVGFGLLFLGMNTMSDAIAPHKEILRPLLAGIHGNNLPNLLTGIGLSLGLTAIWQSSGATIGMCYALTTAGVITSFDQVFPIVLGAHIGTCATALLGSIGTHIDARRCAFAHLFFNLIACGLAVAAAPLFFKLIPYTSSDLVRQTANFHTAVQLIFGLLFLPFTAYHARLTRLLVPSRKPPPEPSYLDDELLARPEQAIYAAIRELQRVTRVCSRSFRLVADVMLFKYSRSTVQRIKLNENVVDEIKRAMKDYLAKMTSRYLSRRQAILIQHLDRCIVDLERIGDHIDEVCDLSLKREGVPEALVDQESFNRLFALYEAAAHIVHLVAMSLDPDHTDFQSTAETILKARDAYVQLSMDAKATFSDKVVSRTVTPIAGMYYTEYIAAFDRIVKHSKSIALAQKQPQFWIKRKKLERIVNEAPRVQPPALVDPHDYLDRLQSEDLL
jgi:phosphate:Na+ symporter